tara:strand:- start:2506 stop:3339 length:834 start_codon:yes stop_codon:yes gene_type:complete
MRRILVLIPCILISCSTLKIGYSECELPIHSPFPGGLINQVLEIKSSEIKNLEINNQNIYLCQVDKEAWRILMPISLYFEEDSLAISYKGQIIKKVQISSKNYRESRITIQNQDLVTPPKKYLDRIKKESELTKTALNTISKKVHSSLIMSLPVEGIKSSEFGVKRFINDKPRNRHTGLDIAAPIGTYINAPLSGKVILVGEFYYRGKTVVLDHGGGLITSYSHMNKLSVELGDRIEKGDLLGEVGETGRVTGAHLHWQVLLFGIPIDPELFVKKNS